jgi:hypothetical protein
VASSEFDIDPRTKLGGEVEWMDGDGWEHFVSALNSGASVPSGSVPGEDGAPADLSLDAAAQLELRALLSRYQ